MHEFFLTRIVEEKTHQANRSPFRRKYFAENCRYDSRADTLRRMESERIVVIDDGESDSRVTTEQTFHYSGGIRKIRLRYHLQLLNGDWLIRDVQSACLVCEGRGDSNCPYCKGKQWLDTEQIRG